MGPGQSFEAQVKPQVTGCVGCHGGGQQPTLTSYAALEPAYKVKPGDTNPLVNKGAHQGPALTATQKTAIVAWINSLP